MGGRRLRGAKSSPRQECDMNQQDQDKLASLTLTQIRMAAAHAECDPRTLKKAIERYPEEARGRSRGLTGERVNKAIRFLLDS